ncbi:MAG: UDP-N-acetylglucosamine 2-epimerase (non-hydrolyzing) [bacterium]|nr:UDP-N-acetylglucosamine 2-epimerase (non-hydrolyzing) [bacterium]
MPTKKILIIFGTRPEAIKLAPLINEIKNTPSLNGIVCVFRQHEEMLNQVLRVFKITPDYDLKITLNDKALFGKNINIFKKAMSLINTGFSLIKFLRILKTEKPDLLIIQGDTSTAFLAAFLGFHFKIPIAHIEAGLRTYNKYSPFPEEMNRQLISRLADLHFTPTERDADNLLKEGISKSNIILTGNTAIDSLLFVRNRQSEENMRENYVKIFKDKYKIDLKTNKKIILLTAHRRESFGEGLRNIFSAIKEIVKRREDVVIIYPVHPNPNVQHLAREMLKDSPNIYLINPVEYDEFIFLMGISYFILTDSGGIQEEAPSLGKPVLVMRENTERQEGVEAGTSKLVGTSSEKIINETLNLLDDKNTYNAMIKDQNPYGDGKAAKRIIEAISNFKNQS